MFKPVQTFSHLFTIVHTCSHLFTPVHICSHLFKTVHPCSHLFTPQWLSTLFAQWQFLVEFSPCESCYFSILHAILLKLHIFAHLIENYLTVSGLSSCFKKKIDPSSNPYYSDHVRPSWNVIFLHFRKLLLFSLTSYPAKIAYFNSPNWELSNFVQLMELYWSKIVDPSRSPCLKDSQLKKVRAL